VKNVSERLNLPSHFLYPFPILQLASLLPGLQFNPGTHLHDEPIDLDKRMPNIICNTREAD